MLKARIAGVGLGLPSKVLTNDDLSKFVDTSDEWIQTRTGIKERRVVNREAGEDHLAIALAACQEALQKANCKPEEIDLIICATMSPDTWMPNASARLSGALNAPQSATYDLNSACTGFLAALSTADCFIRSGRMKKVLVVAAEAFSSILDWNDRKTCVLFGDGAGAALLEAVPGDDPLSSGIIDFKLGTICDSAESLTVPGGATRFPEKRMHILMQGQEVFKTGSRAMAEVAHEVLVKTNTQPESIDWFVPHQANLRIIEMVAKIAEIPKEKIYVNVDRWGNTSAATIAICLAEMDRQGLLKRGQLILLDAFGGGFTYGAMLLRW